MNINGERPPNGGDQGEIGAERRSRKPSRKALQNAVDRKRDEVNSLNKKLVKMIQAAESPDGSLNTESVLHDLATGSGELNEAIQELIGLYAQDVNNDFGADVLVTRETLTLQRAYAVMKRIKSRKSDKLLELNTAMTHCSSRNSKSVKSSSCVSSASSARIKAIAEAAAARESAEFERKIAEKELQRRKGEAEFEQERAQHEKDLAVLTANKRVAMADAKVKAIEQAMTDNEIGKTCEPPGMPRIGFEERILDWVHTIPSPEALPAQRTPLVQPQSQAKQNAIFSQFPSAARPQIDDGSQRRPVIASTPIRDVTGSQLIETLTSTNQQIVASLARQNFPKCQPDIFSGDATLFHPWKAAFKAMIRDADVSPTQEINYLRSFTSGEPQRLVDNFRRRQSDPVTLLQSLWKELEMRFGSAAIITNFLLERMQRSATFSESNNAKLQHFADLCADVESQISYLPGLAFLNYPNTIQPIAEKLPPSLRGKWEKEIVKYAETNAGAYPNFRRFSKVIQSQARLKNNPNILAGSKSINHPTNHPTPNASRASRKALKTNARPAPNKQETPSYANSLRRRRCPLHDREGHDLFECKAFAAKSLDEKTEWIKGARLCFRCLFEGHQAANCKANVICSICGDDRHVALLHKAKGERTETQSSGEAEIQNRCTAICDSSGGLSCSKIVLVDVYSRESPTQIRRVYAIIDEQSNSSLISSELADDLGADGPPERYYLSTCSTEREERYGRRITGVTVRSLNGAESTLPTLIECDSIPQDRREIPTREMARFPHLQEIAGKIPPLDRAAGIHLLIGRDQPELLKVREFRNGPKGAPWAQRLSLGWTITGQVCLDLIDGPAHVLVHRISLHATNADDSELTKIDGYELVPWPNKFTVKGSLAQTSVEDNVFATTRHDNQVALSREDRKFLEIMERDVHKNSKGNLEMPLPFRQEEVQMPNNRMQAVNRLNGLLRTLKRKPQMQSDYFDFMEKIIEKGHASVISEEELKPEAKSGKVWYLPHFGVYHPKKPTQIRVVFDSSAEYNGVSLNKTLLPGPDLMNSLVGVLVRFRKESTAVMCDIEQMFHSFHVTPKHRDFLRFLWFEGNDINKRIIEYRMNVHLFGNGPSPAVATFGLRQTAAYGEEEFGEEAKKFVCRNFYVDDGLVSTATPQQAVTLVTNAQAMLAKSNLRLHKVVSNSIEVMEAFPPEDRGKDIRDLDCVKTASLPSFRSGYTGT